MRTPKSLKSAANGLIALGAFYLLIISAVLYLVYFNPATATPPKDSLGPILLGFLGGLGLLLWLAAFLLYRCHSAGRLIWWIGCPFVLLQFPIGTGLGLMVFIYLNERDVKKALAGEAWE